MRIWTLAWPIILSNITVPLLGLVDTAVVGHLPDSRYLAAVTLGATLFSFLYWGFGFLRMGTTGLVAQAIGREAHSDVRNLLGQSLIMAAVIGALLIIFGSPLISLGLWLLDGSEAATPLAREYAEIRLWSAPAVLANYAILGWFLGQQNARVTLMILVLTNSVNIVLDLWFVVGLGMTSGGVALASVIADYSALTFGGYLVLRQLGHLEGGFQRQRLLVVSAYSALVNVNANLFVRTLGLLFAMAFFTAQGARQGDTVLAANAVLLQFIMLTSYALDGFAHAAESLVGRAYGRRDWREFAATVRATAQFSFWTATVATVAFALAGNYLVAMLTGLAEVRATAASYLPWMIVMPLIAVWSYLFDGVFIGTTAVREMRNSIFIGLAVYLPTWWLSQGLGNHGLWLALTLFMLTRSVVLIAYYYRYRQRYWRPQG
ncbi:MATE family efflux transporter [Vreelandella venusta]|uniref:MATE family efflux transporter n=1 Tax=Vreelandella venusta TaxID=44935 RepID=A0AAP9ZDK0_9GAMM|nr:MATE family efflux transporter [Halomonas venusta]MBR9926730.1 MATE family efflux transporter [Gammaproteobacteria bacterium]AZM97210.1 MATE family efflux transporter [Halomonas venusta]NPT32500.1 MATE family efflux transporter [Halomonas venusta]QRL02688.1 MATE family efflux transporter [Halomonas venusta]UQI39964.1 MATE family efflux transporter [Halomonas venusta]